MYNTKRITPKNNLRNHTNWNHDDWAYLRDKGYTREQIRAIWDRDASLGQPAQKHLTSYRYA